MNITEYPNLPQTADEWAAQFQTEFSGWSAVRESTVGAIIMDALSVATSLDDLTEGQVDDYILRPMASRAGYSSGLSVHGGGERRPDDERVATWLSDIVEEALSPDTGEAEQVATPGEPTVVQYIERLAPNLADHLAERGTPEKFSQIVEVVTYQFNNWKAGKRTVATNDKAHSQFNRRMNREHKWTTTGSYDSHTTRTIQHILNTLRKIAAGEEVLMLPMAPTQDQVQSAFSKDHRDLFDRVDGYYLGYVGYRMTASWRRNGEPGDQDAFHDRWVTNVVDFCSRTESEKYSRDDTALIYSVLVDLAFGTSGGGEPVETVTDYESLVAWMLDLHKDAGSLQVDAIKDGLADWFDTVRDDPERIDKEGVVESMRRQVMAYGFTRFTGKALRPTLRATLQVVLDKHRDEGLTLDEWRTRWARRDKAVSYVSGRYGEEQNLCSVLEKATKELGILPTRKPKHKIRFEGSGVLVEVEVESWMDDQYKLQNSAREQWSKMTDAQKESAIIERRGVYVDWGQMQVAR